jgi:hypothetical protein
MSAPVTFTWDGDTMVPLPRFARLCDKRFVVGETYPLDVAEPRSRASHNHYFAAVHDAWLNLREEYAEDFPSDEHLRKWCLIRAGYADKRSTVCASKAEAQRIAAFIKPIDGFAVVTVSEAVVTVYTAQSQSVKAMGAKVFQESKQKVLDTLADMIGVDTAELQRQAGQAA